MENLYNVISECDKKLIEQRNKLLIFDGKSNIKNLTTEQATIISEVSINLFFMLDKFPIIMLETLASKDLESVNKIQEGIKEIQSRIMEILGRNSYS